MTACTHCGPSLFTPGPLSFINFSNSAETNCGPLSLTTCRGSPKAANTSRRSAIKLAIVVFGIHVNDLGPFWVCVFYYQVCLATERTCKANMYSSPLPNPWMYSGATSEVFLTYWQAVQAFIIPSPSWSMAGHQTWLWASVFICTTLGVLDVTHPIPASAAWFVPQPIFPTGAPLLKG